MIKKITIHKGEENKSACPFCGIGIDLTQSVEPCKHYDTRVINSISTEFHWKDKENECPYCHGEITDKHIYNQVCYPFDTDGDFEPVLCPNCKKRVSIQRILSWSVYEYEE